MSAFDALISPDNGPAADHNGAAATKMSLEGNQPPLPSATPQAETQVGQAQKGETGRGHSAHAGSENPEILAPTKPTIVDHLNDGTATGIDVSEFQNTIDWSQVQKAGVEFAYIRATEGTTIQDADFVQNWQGAEKAGVLVGPYHYFTTSSPVQSQIDNFVSELKKVDAGNLPPVLDVEDAIQFTNYTVPQRIAMIQQWLDGVQQQTGLQPMLYMSSNFSSTVLGNTAQFDKYKLWVADYTTAAQPVVPQPWTTWNFWQHADNGQVPGITGDVDMDYFNGPLKSLSTTPPKS